MTWTLFGQLEHTTAQTCDAWTRALPPEGLEVPAEKAAAWNARIELLDKQLAQNVGSAYWADVEVLVKACRLAIRFREFYQEKDFAKCDRLLTMAEQRVAWLPNKLADPTQPRSGPLPGVEGEKRLQVRGFISRVDGSAQPVGLIMPDKQPAAGSQLPLFVWLHGRGDKATDLHFLCDRQDKAGEVAPADAITLHPFGRHCVGYKNAGATDVMEAIDFACANYPIDTRKIVLIGFSMGGAGVWHLAAHHADRFVAASPGAGFAETKRYQNLTPDKYPPKYEQLLWSVYDVPDYTRNLFNLPVIAYSGENDKQIQAARVMEEAFQAEGRTLQHLIGPGMGHKYHPEVLKDLVGRLSKIAATGQNSQPDQLHLQTRHLRVHRAGWVSVEGQLQQYADTRVTAQRKADVWQVMTKNVSRLTLTPPPGASLIVDQSSILRPAGAKAEVSLQRSAAGQWQTVEALPTNVKRPGVSGPIDDAFFEPFVFVTPTGKSSNARLNQWVECEQSYAIERWTSLMRGAPRVMRDIDIKPEDMQKYHLVLWGDVESNQVLARVLKQPNVPLVWSKEEVTLGEERWPASSSVPACIMPNPLAPSRYVVVNSGLTFRDAHDRTNSLQNPHLPDWAVFSLDGPRTAAAAGPVLAAGFFNDQWKFDPTLLYR
ncbi:MAG: prolyl oligopeptidase family serine peptidase [Pirellulaceae bacterium]|nr:prolyl oligopeptidase family serine peptidase [Pirellulaceae bacterium]